MSIEKAAPLLPFVLLCACPGTKEGSTGSSGEPTTTAQTIDAAKLSEVDWDALLAGLQESSIDAPRSGPMAVQSGPGNMNITDVSTSSPDQIGSFGTSFVQTGVYSEEWAVRDPALLGAQAGRALLLEHVRGGPRCVTRKNADALCVGEGAGCAYSRATMTVGYYAFPSPTAVGKLPATNPPGTTRVETFAVYSIGPDELSEDLPPMLQGMPEGTVLSGRLHRQVTSTANGEIWKDYWVFYESFWLIGDNISAKLVAVTDAATDPECHGPHGTLKDMLDDVRAGSACAAPGGSTRPAVKWYSPTSYSWATMPAPSASLGPSDCVSG